MASVFNGIEFNMKEPSLIPFNEFLLPFRQSMKEFLEFCATNDKRLVNAATTFTTSSAASNKPKLSISTDAFHDNSLAEQYVSMKTPGSTMRLDIPSPSKGEMGSPTRLEGEAGEPSFSKSKMSLRKKPSSTTNRSVLNLFSSKDSPSGSELAINESNKSTQQLDSPTKYNIPLEDGEGSSTIKLLKKKTMSIKNLFSSNNNSENNRFANESMSQLSNDSDEKMDHQSTMKRSRNPTKSIKNFFIPQAKIALDVEFVEFVEELRKVEGVIRPYFVDKGKKLPDGESRELFILRFDEWWTLVKEYEI